MLRPQTKIQNGTEFTRGGVYPMRLLLFAGDAATQEDFQAIFGKNSDLVGTGPGAGESTREFGGTSSNQRFAVMHTTVKDPASKQTYFFCMYCVWAADKKTVITFMFETPAKYVSATGNSLQVKWFKEQARKIIDSAL